MICMQGVNCRHKKPVFSDSDIQSQSFSTVLPVSHLSRITSVMDCKESFEHKIYDSRKLQTLEGQTAVTECLSPSANTAYVDISRLTVVHRRRPGGQPPYVFLSFLYPVVLVKRIQTNCDQSWQDEASDSPYRTSERRGQWWNTAS